MFQIDKNTTIQKVKAYLESDDGKEKLTESKKRRERLEKLACMRTGKQIYVELSGDRAGVDIAPRNSELGYTDRLVITIPIEIPDQVVTNLDKEKWELMFQKVELYHELGHVEYTDWPSLEEVIFGSSYGIEEEYHGMFHQFWNIVEDAAVERILSSRYNIEDELRIKNENLIRSRDYPGSMSLAKAVATALMKYKHPTGMLDKLMDENNSSYTFLSSSDREVFEDEILPLIQDIIPNIVNEDDPERRNILMYDFFQEIKHHFDDSMTPGANEDVSFDFPIESEEMGEGSHGENPSQTSQEDFPDDWEDFEQPDMKKVQQEFDSQRDYDDDIEEDREDVEKSSESIEEWQRIIDTDYDLETDMVLEVLEDSDVSDWDDQRRSEAERLSKPIAKELNNRLKQQSRTQKQRRRKSGKVDSKRVHKTKQGKTNVFTNHSDPDAKDYACMIVVDRSGSMNDHADMIPDTEIAAGAFAYALEDVGIDYGQIGMHWGKAQLEKDFGESVDDAKQRMFRGVSGGGTPMSDALALARERLNVQGSHPFVIVITDGEPDHRERYRDQLSLCDFPVLGVYIKHNEDFNESHMNESAYFHRLEMRKYDEAIDAVTNLAKKVMF